jgi:acetyl esterase
MVLDPQLQRVIASMHGPAMTGFARVSAPEAGEAIAASLALQGAPRPVASVGELAVPSPGGPLPARTYRPAWSTGTAAGSALPVLVYFPGAGFTLGDLELADRPCRALANATGAVVASVACRAGDEQPFPAAVRDAGVAARWFAEHADELGGDPTRIGVAGDGAGGTLAALVALRARAHGDPVLALQVLIYPAVDLAGWWPSRAEFADGCPLTSADLDRFTEHYLNERPGTSAPGATELSPLRADDLSGLPPTVVVTAGHDPLRDEGQVYAAALNQAGVPVLDCRNDTMAHGFLGMAGAVEHADAVFTEIGDYAREVFATAISAAR